MECTFCEDVSRSGEIVHEDGHCWVVLHNDWAVRGHAMVIPKRHAENVADLEPDEWLHLARVWQYTERALLELTGAERSIVMKLGIQTPHLHIHVFPFSSTASRDQVFSALDAVSSEAHDPLLVELLRARLSAPQR